VKFSALAELFDWEIEKRFPCRMWVSQITPGGQTNMIVSMWMTREIVAIEAHTPIIEASAIMASKRIRRLPVIERHESGLRPVGIITATDILHAYPPEVNPFSLTALDRQNIHTTAGEIMSRTLRMIAPDTPIEDAARIMRDAKISTLLVVHHMKLIGLITESDIFRAFVGILESTGAGARITFEITNHEDPFGLIAPMALRLGAQVNSLMTMHKDGRKLCVIRIAGAAQSKMIDALWTSGHNVINVTRKE
jgi:acetoin utilization protein AcuB